MGIRRNQQRGTWQVDRRYTVRGTTERVRKDFPTKAAAQKYLRALEEDIRKVRAGEKLGLLPPAAADAPEKQGRTFASWWQDCREHFRVRNSATTLARKDSLARCHLLPAFGELPLASVTPALIGRLQDQMLARGLKPASVRQAMAVLGACLRRAYRLGVSEHDPMRRVDKVKVKRAEQAWTFLDFEETERYLAAAAKDSPTWHALLLTAVRTGLRRGELLGLRWLDVDLHRAVLTVRNARTKAGGVKIVEGPPKSGKARSVGMTGRVVDALRALPSRGRSGYVFTTAAREPIEPDRERAAHRRAVKRAAIGRHVRFHDLRHTWASHLAMRGVSLAVVQQLGGWASYQMVQRYAHLSRESVVSAVNVLEPERQPGGVDEPRPLAERGQVSNKVSNRTLPDARPRKAKPRIPYRIRGLDSAQGRI